MNGAFKQNNTDLALELIEEMMNKTQQYQQIGRWALEAALSKRLSLPHLDFYLQ